MNQQKPLNILLADDNKDDRFLFERALKEIPIATCLKTVEDGEKLMDYLLKNTEQLPDVLFLDLNMPRKNGSECLTEIKASGMLNQLSVIIYSASLHEDIVDVLYKNGAHHYLRKHDLLELKTILDHIHTQMN